MEQGRDKALRLSNKKTNLLPRDLSESLGKLPPQAIELEEDVLGAVMLERAALLEVVDFLKPEHFYLDAHREIYQACIELFRESNPVDMKSVYARLRKNGKAEMIGGAIKLADLTGQVSSSANIEYHSRIIIEMAIKRDLIQLASGIHNDAYDDTTDVFELLGFIDLELENLSKGNLSVKGEKHVKDIAVDEINALQKRMQGVPDGILSEFDEIDKITHGWQNSDLIILAARPGMAKTAALAQMLYNMAVRGEPTAMFSVEMPASQVLRRLAIGISELDPEKVKTGSMTQLELERYTNALGTISRVPMFIDDQGGINILELRAKARRMWKKYGIKCIGVDYIQLVSGLGNLRQGPGMNRDQEIGVVSRTLKAIAKELNIPVIALSSLNRGVETRGGDKRPTLADLRESGNIESDADIVVFLYRPEYYHISTDEEGFNTHGKAEFIFAKHRNGSLGTAVQKFIGKFTKFTTWNYGAGDRAAPATPMYHKPGFDASGYKNVLPNEDRNEPEGDTPF